MRQAHILGISHRITVHNVKEYPYKTENKLVFIFFLLYLIFQKCHIIQAFVTSKVQVTVIIFTFSGCLVVWEGRVQQKKKKTYLGTQLRSIWG